MLQANMAPTKTETSIISSHAHKAGYRRYQFQCCEPTWCMQRWRPTLSLPGPYKPTWRRTKLDTNVIYSHAASQHCTRKAGYQRYQFHGAASQQQLL
eukprot:8837422-Prorocentrum_lima.AAC.1